MGTILEVPARIMQNDLPIQSTNLPIDEKQKIHSDTQNLDPIYLNNCVYIIRKQKQQAASQQYFTVILSDIYTNSPISMFVSLMKIQPFMINCRFLTLFVPGWGGGSAPLYCQYWALKLLDFS